MTDTEVRVRRTATDEVDAVAVVLARAFFEDPIYRWAFPDPRQRRRALPFWMRALPLTVYGSTGPVEGAAVEGHVVGAAVRSDPGRTEPGWGVILRSLPDMLRAAGPASLRGFQRLDHAVGSVRPTEPHHYLFHLGTDPGWWGHGVGSALLGSLTARADADALPTHLETKPGNVAYYQRFGFAVTERVPFDAVELWGMARPPS